MATSILDQLLASAKKFPANAVGAPVDIANIALGAITGKGLEGYTKKPVGGSEQLNSLFGLDSNSGGLGEDIATAVSSLITPGGAVKGALAGMVVPARMLKSFPEFNAIQKMFKEGKSAEEIFKTTGAYKVPGDETIKMVLDDAQAKLINPKRELAGYQSNTRAGPEQTVSVGELFTPAKLPDVLDHPEFWKMVDANPELASLRETKVGPGLLTPQGNASYNS